jgi:murein DD-endopeptidase MepM/ murein hydrolase activator NlpD
VIRRAALATGILLAACGGNGGGAQCGPYADQATSPYILPYEVGTSHQMIHGNCTARGTSHQAGGTREHAYDFRMPIGTVLIASRAGIVRLVEQQFADGTRNPAENNFVIITHQDGTHGRYFHIAQNGSLVAVNQAVGQGDPIALSGDSGESTEPHLHFVVEPAGNPPGEPHGGTPVVFLNTEPHPNGLLEGRSYQALPYPGCDCDGP